MYYGDTVDDVSMATRKPCDTFAVYTPGRINLT